MQTARTSLLRAAERTQGGRDIRAALRVTMGLAIGLGLLGCATPPAPPAPLAAPPPDASPELAFLVGRELEADGRTAEALAAYQQVLASDPDSPFLLKLVAELSARENQLDQAIGYAERAAELEPDDAGVRLFLGTLYRFERNPDGARRVLTDEHGEPRDADSAVLLFGVMAEANRLEEARSVAEWLVAHEPDGVRSWLALADVEQRAGDSAAAEAALRRGLKRLPGELSLYGALARMRREAGDREGELAIYDEMLARQPDHHATLLAKADAEIALGRSDDARRTLERVEAKHPGDLRTLLRLAFLDYEQADYASAEERFQRALGLQPQQYEVAYFLGVVQRRRGEKEAAAATFALIPPSHERYAEARLQLASMLEEGGDLDGALAEVERAREVQPAQALDLYRASLLSHAGRRDEALALLETLRAQSPDDVEVLYQLGVVQGEAQDMDAALASMQAVLAIDPDHAGALNFVGYTWAERGERLDEAEALIARALALRPGDGFITDSLGWVYYKRAVPLKASGDESGARAWLDRALEELHRAAELTGGDPVISEHLGDAYLLGGDRERALAHYEDAMRQAPRPGEQPDLPGKLERLRKELGRP